MQLMQLQEIAQRQMPLSVFSSLSFVPLKKTTFQFKMIKPNLLYN